MAYAAMISLKHTIERLLYSSDISLVPPSPEIIEYAYKELKSLQEVLKRLDSNNNNISRSRKRVNALDGEIREAVCKLEDVLESHVSNQILSQSGSLGGGESTHPLLFSIDLQDLKQDIHCFTETVKKMEEEYINELDNPLPEEKEDEDEALSSTIDFGGKKSEMVGLSDQLSEAKYRITGISHLGLHPVFLFGMAGIGKTTLAKEIFEDPDILKHFSRRAWVKVGKEREAKEIARDILAQVNSNTDKMLMEGDEKIARYLKKSLKHRRYLIVLDDLWDADVLDELFKFLPENENKSRALVTTRMYQPMLDTLKMRFLNKEESWDLLRKKVFGEELCPHELEKAGKKIAENCEGLPLTIVMVANVLSKAEKTPEYWNKVAEKQNSVFMDAYDEISKVLLPSYNCLPQQQKACFLYMGVFPPNYKIPVSKLTNMWIAEGILEPNISQTSEGSAKEYLLTFVWVSLVIVYQNSTISPWSFIEHYKTCGLHSTFWHLCNREAGKNKFFLVLNSCADALVEGIKGQRRMCIHNNVLFGIKDVCKSMEYDCTSTARSLLCFGPYHQYPVPICFGLRLLRVLDALTIRFYKFPMEALKLVQLRYLALTYNGNIPASISKLWKLQFLIVGRHLNIKSSSGAAPSYLPLEIWDMQELKHLQVMGSNLVHDTNCGALLPNLLRLLDVNIHSCTEGVLRRIPNLKKLGIQIELVPDTAEPLCWFDHISHLNKLESLKCVIVNPEFRSEFILSLPPHSMFPSSLKKLNLSGFGYPWEHMRAIALLPNLQVLKLRCYAFRGPIWKTKEDEFPRLKVLLIEDTDLVLWKVGRGSFDKLDRVSITHCYTLEDVHWDSDRKPEKMEIEKYDV